MSRQTSPSMNLQVKASAGIAAVRLQPKVAADSSEREQGMGEAVYNHGKEIMPLSQRRYHCVEDSSSLGK